MTTHLRIIHRHTWKVLAITLPVLLFLSTPPKKNESVNAADLSPFVLRVTSNHDSVSVRVKRFTEGSCVLYAQSPSSSYLLAVIVGPGSYGYPLKKDVERVYLYDNLNNKVIAEQLLK
jgi:hypothetical protein